MTGTIQRQSAPSGRTYRVAGLAIFPFIILTLFLPLAAHAGLPAMDWPTVAAYVPRPGGTLVAIVSAIIGGIVLGWVKERYRVAQAVSARQEHIRRLESAQLAMQAEGNESEQHVGNTMLAWARELDAEATMQTGVIFRYPDGRPDQVSKFEIDCLLITRFGVFVVEVKNWKHPVSVTANGWVVDKPSGREAVKSPLIQNQPKQRVLHALANEARPHRRPINVHSAVILPHRLAEVAMHVPAEAMYLHESRLVLRQTYHAAQKIGLCSSDELGWLKARLHSQIDTDPMAKHYFLLELFDKKGFAAEYKALDVERLAAINTPPEEPRSVWKCAATYIPALALAAWMGIGAQWSGLQHKNTPVTAAPAIPAVSKPTSKTAPASPSTHKARHRKREPNKGMPHTDALERT